MSIFVCIGESPLGDLVQVPRLINVGVRTVENLLALLARRRENYV